MANRTTVKSNIVTKNVPTVNNTILGDILNADLADNICFREDVAVTQSSSASAISVDFTGKDRVDLTRTGGTLNITVTGIEDGETKFLLVTKTAGQAVTWVGVTDITPIKSNADALPLVLYEIVRKGSNYFVKAWVETIQVASGAQVIAGTSNVVVLTPQNLAVKDAGLITKIIDIGDWNMGVTTSVTIAHGIADKDKIKQVTAMIRADAGSTFANLTLGTSLTGGSAQGAVGGISNTTVGLVSSGVFSTSGEYVNTSYNRGWLIIKYLP